MKMEYRSHQTCAKCEFLHTACTRSPYVPSLPWRAPCCRCNFLWDTGGIHRIAYSLQYFRIYLYL